MFMADSADLTSMGLAGWQHRLLQDEEEHPAEEAHGGVLRPPEPANGPNPLSIRWKQAAGQSDT